MRHRFHSICPYFAMFPESFADKHLCLADPSAVVLDPFSGRGTTVFQALLTGRIALGVDVNPVAVCVSRAKASPPTAAEVRSRIDELECAFEPATSGLLEDEFFRACFARRTLQQILWLREQLQWRTDRVDCFIAAMAAGCLHGESHRSARVFSNRMPRTIATKPAYSVAWWANRGYEPPERDVFDILRLETDFRYVSSPAPTTGYVKEGDARDASKLLPEWKEKVSLVITSPPYLDVTHFREDQWLRVWFLGGEPRPCSAKEGDDRHFDDRKYWNFLEESWRGLADLLTENARIVIRIGGNRVTEQIAERELTRTLTSAIGNVACKEVVTSEIKKGQLRAFRPNARGTRREFDCVFERA